MNIRSILFGVLIGLATMVGAATFKSDITDQGVESYLRSQITAQQLATMIRDYETLTAVNTLTYDDCGKTLFLNSATEFATTLPSPSAGCQFTFIVKAAPVGANYTVVTASSANIIIGGTVSTEDAAGTAEYDGDADTLTFVASKSLVGDFISLFSDGTSWYITGSTVNVEDGITVTKAS